MKRLIGTIIERTIFNQVKQVGASGTTWELYSEIYDLRITVILFTDKIKVSYLNRHLEDEVLPRAYNDLYLDLLPTLEEY